MDPLCRFRQVSSSPLFGTAAGEALRQRIRSGTILPLCGAHDAFSALAAAKRFESVFCSGFGAHDQPARSRRRLGGDDRRSEAPARLPRPPARLPAGGTHPDAHPGGRYDGRLDQDAGRAT